MRADSSALRPRRPATLYVLALLLFATSAFADQIGSWIPLGPRAATVFALERDPLNPAVVYAGMYFGGLYCSQNGGLSWKPVPSDFSTSTVFGIAIDPAVAGTLYVATYDHGIHKSVDSDATWTPVPGGMPAQVVIKLELDPAAPGAVLASTREGVFRRRPDASGWDSLTCDLPVQTVGQTLRHPTTGTLFAATASGVFRLDLSAPTSWVPWTTIGARHLLIDPTGTLIHVASTTGSLAITGDDGKSFWPADYGIQNCFVKSLVTVNALNQTVIYAGTDHDVEFTSEAFRTGVELPRAGGSDRTAGVFDVAPHPIATGTLFSGTEGSGVWKTTNYGQTWASASKGIVPSGVLSLDQSPAADHTLYAGTTYGIFGSSDNGLTWTPNIDTTPRPVSAVLADPVRNRVAYYGTGAGEVFRTFDAGKNFYRVWEGVGQGIRKLAEARWGNLYAVNVAGELYASDDLGLHFYRQATEISQEIVTVGVDPDRPWVVYVGTVFGGVYKSESDAIEWIQRNGGIDSPTVFGIALDRNNPRVLVAAAPTGVYKSTDRGVSWQLAGSGLIGLPVRQLLIDGNSIYAGTAGQGICASQNGGATWLPTQDPDGALYVTGLAAGTGSGLVYAATVGNGVMHTSSSGSGFDGGTEASYAQAVFHWVVDPRTTSTLYAATGGQGVLKSVDGGISWRGASQGLDSPFLVSLVIDPVQPDTLYARTTGGGGILSENGAASWRQLNAGLFHKRVACLTIDVNDHRVIYAGTEGGGICRLRR